MEATKELELQEQIRAMSYDDRFDFLVVLLRETTVWKIDEALRHALTPKEWLELKREMID